MAAEMEEKCSERGKKSQNCHDELGIEMKQDLGNKTMHRSMNVGLLLPLLPLPPFSKHVMYFTESLAMPYEEGSLCDR